MWVVVNKIRAECLLSASVILGERKKKRKYVLQNYSCHFGIAVWRYCFMVTERVECINSFYNEYRINLNVQMLNVH